MPHALMIDGDRASLDELVEPVERAGFSIQMALSLREARDALAQRRPAVVLTEVLLSDGNALELFEQTISRGVPTVVITGHASIDSAVEWMRLGAIDYLTKPFDVARLKTALAYVLRTSDLHETDLRKPGRFGPLVGASSAMNAVYNSISRIAPTDATVCIVGESGTGKELVAAAVHQFSRRRREPFVAVNCGGVSPTLIESTLFGHEKGSFTGADRTHRGVFEQASGGTLFLDEITEMPIEMQVKLLRVLETGTVGRVGAETIIGVDVRVIVATNRVPKEAIAEGKLRHDLWYRVMVFPIVVPPLRHREGDITLLAEHFLAELNAREGTEKQWSAGTLPFLEECAWPGNVRELKNLIYRAHILADNELSPASCVYDI